MNFEKFGNAYIEIESICGVTFAYEEDYVEQGVSGIMTKQATDKLREVAVFFKSGAILKMNGQEALDFEKYWNYVMNPVGDIA